MQGLVGCGEDLGFYPEGDGSPGRALNREGHAVTWHLQAPSGHSGENSVGVRVGSLRGRLHWSRHVLIGPASGLGCGEKWLHLKVEPAGLADGQGWVGGSGVERWEEPQVCDLSEGCNYPVWFLG